MVWQTNRLNLVQKHLLSQRVLVVLYKYAVERQSLEKTWAAVETHLIAALQLLEPSIAG